MLVRRLIGRRLAAYYAQSADLVVGCAGDFSPRLSSLLGEWHWKSVYRQMYQKQKGQWLTPVELFKPHYSNILANFVASCFDADKDSSVDIVELGGGRGTNARLILDYLHDASPDLYQRVSYTIIDSSPTLHELQSENLLSSVHASKIQLELKDLMDVAEGKEPLLSRSKRLTVVLALELFDNLASDKIRVKAGRLIEQAEITRADGKEVSDDAVLSDSQNLEESFMPLSDPLIKMVVQTAPSYTRSSVTWIPTVACGVLNKLGTDRPNSRLLVADFDWLPPPDKFSAGVSETRASVWANGEPLITSMDGYDHDCYLRAPPFCDILFPTNFRKLASFVERSWKGKTVKVSVQKQAEFLQEYGRDQVKATQSWLTGYTPLLHDFGNCSVLTVTLAPSSRIHQ